jgi:hypothetical protein
LHGKRPEAQMTLQQICNGGDSDRCDAFRRSRREPAPDHTWMRNSACLGSGSAITAQQLRCCANVLSAMHGIRIVRGGE